MPTINVAGDYFELENENSVGNSYLKNVTVKLGKFNRDSTFVDEELIKLATGMGLIPAGSTITAVESKFTVVTNVSGGAATPEIRAQNKAVSTDTGSQPTYNLRNGSDAWSAGDWNPLVRQFPSLGAGATGVQTATSDATIVAHFQDILDGVITIPEIMLTMNTSFSSWYSTINTIEFNVTYTAPVVQSKMMIL